MSEPTRLTMEFESTDQEALRELAAHVLDYISKDHRLAATRENWDLGYKFISSMSGQTRRIFPVPKENTTDVYEEAFKVMDHLNDLEQEDE